MDLDDGKPFIWHKKYEELGVDIDERQIEEEVRRQIEENKIELAKIKERQRKRELEQQQRLNDIEFLQRQKETEQHQHWEQQEDEFFLRQNRQRSKIRIRDGRAQPIDLLAHYIDTFGVRTTTEKGPGFLIDDSNDINNPQIQLLNPCEWFNGLSLSDLEKLESDIVKYMKADNHDNQQFWTDVLDLTRCEQSSVKIQPGSSDAIVLEEIIASFKKKTVSELNDVEVEISRLLKSGDPSVDENFYKNALIRLRGERARKRLTENHAKNILNYKPPDPVKLLPQNDAKPDLEASKKGEEAFLRAAKEGMDDREEALFSCESVVSKPRGYKWSNQYEPRKPSYLNRVRTGFEWNKYNRTHYDIDNPPPKAVQGYKFNIYYPDLINKSDTPEFFVVPCEDDKDFAIIRFSAGPPYEDIAFKIVNKDWNKSPKSGYVCQFKRGVLQLWFVFKRYRYRR